jgi:hypothetical protein
MTPVDKNATAKPIQFRVVLPESGAAGLRTSAALE